MPRKSVSTAANTARLNSREELHDCAAYSPLELAARFGVSRRHVYDWLAKGWLRGQRTGGRWRVSERDAALFEVTCRGYHGRLMPSLYEWDSVWMEL